MITLQEKMINVSSYLKVLTTPEIVPKVKEAVEKKDANALMKICKKVKIPQAYRSIITSIVLSVSPEEKYPLFM